MRLPGTEQWSPEAISRRIAFERNVVRGALPLLREIAVANSFRDPGETSRRMPSDAIFALGRAAGLAFATENVALGREICEQILAREMARTPFQFAFQAVIGALTGNFVANFDASGIVILRREQQEALSGLRLGWPASSGEIVTLIRLLLPAVVASGFASEAFKFFSSGIETRIIKPSAFAVLNASPEYHLLLSMAGQGFQSDDDQSNGFPLLEANYVRRLNILQGDRYYWRTLRPRGAIIDWSLLAFSVAAMRFPETGAARRMTAQGEVGKFIQWLSSELTIDRRLLKR